MDTLAHGLWGGMIGGWKKRFGLAFMFGVAPDLLSFGILTVVRVVQGQFSPGKPSVSTIPQWVHTSYDFTHSLVIVGAVWAVLWWWKKDLAVPFIAWPLHILFDIPTHTREFFPTPFLFPLSDYTFDGFSWGQRWFMILNYSCLAAFSILWAMQRHLRRKRPAGSARVHSRVVESSPQEEESLSGRSA